MQTYRYTSDTVHLFTEVQTAMLKTFYFSGVVGMPDQRLRTYIYCVLCIILDKNIEVYADALNSVSGYM